MHRKKYGKIYYFFCTNLKKWDNSETTKTTTYKLKFIDSFRFTPTSLSSLVDNLSEVNKEECKACMNGKNIKSECDFIGHENNNLRFKSKKCERIFLKPSFSSIAKRISEINKKEWKACMERKNIKSECDFIGNKDNQLSYKCKKCNKKWLKPVKVLIKKYSIIYQFGNGDLNKFVLLLRKGVYPYENMDSWETFDETSIPPKEAF